MNETPGDLKQQAEEFGQEMAGLLLATLPGLPDPPVEILSRQSRYVIRTSERSGLPLYVKGQVLGRLDVSAACELDSVGRYLAVHRSTFGLTAAVDRTPVLRIDYRRDMYSAPAAHVQVHGHRGALSHLLSQAGHAHPHEMASLHIPVGGSRFRPCLEDFIQFLICECCLDAKDGWKAYVEAGRERWRCRQAAAVVRDVPEVAARVLRDLGYSVEPPAEIPAAAAKTLHNW